MAADASTWVEISGLLPLGTPCLDFQDLAKAQHEDTTQPDAFGTSLQLQDVPIQLIQIFMVWIAQFRVSTTHTSDRGGQFGSNLWHRLMQLLGLHRVVV